MLYLLRNRTLLFQILGHRSNYFPAFPSLRLCLLPSSSTTIIFPISISINAMFSSSLALLSMLSPLLAVAQYGDAPAPAPEYSSSSSAAAVASTTMLTSGMVTSTTTSASGAAATSTGTLHKVSVGTLSLAILPFLLRLCPDARSIVFIMRRLGRFGLQPQQSDGCCWRSHRVHLSSQEPLRVAVHLRHALLPLGRRQQQRERTRFWIRSRWSERYFLPYLHHHRRSDYTSLVLLRSRNSLYVLLHIDPMPHLGFSPVVLTSIEIDFTPD